jgi:hypothetical protein
MAGQIPRGPAGREVLRGALLIGDEDQDVHAFQAFSGRHDR